ncbi:TM2 domain-containing protein [Butyrivibrio sp. AC2005]|uniref:TM2 domain-containing protein n=1 Tax=Butyrivibrio sp. AC2005 TaxID=1280672 RepID=UPI00041955B3|nr:TM2 domain-containing protein [Butyrivibrio sp. AC2005]
MINKKEKYITDEDGQQYVLKYEDKRICGISTGLIGEEVYYPVSEIDTSELILKTTILGFLGVHKFLLGQIMQGLAYIMTCGGAGLLPMLDILSMVTGNYYYIRNDYSNDGLRISEQRYLKGSEKKLPGLIMAIISGIIGFVIANTLYLTFLKGIVEIIGNIVSVADPHVFSVISK